MNRVVITSELKWAQDCPEGMKMAIYPQRIKSHILKDRNSTKLKSNKTLKSLFSTRIVSYKQIIDGFFRHG